jgi:hypothetical protein
MTVALEENAEGESSSTPPRKKLCLHLRTRKLVPVPDNKETHVNKNNSNNAVGNDFKDKYPKLSTSSVNSNSSSDRSRKKASNSLKSSEKNSVQSGNNFILSLHLNFVKYFGPFQTFMSTVVPK